MKQLTYDTPCFEAFCDDFLLGEDDYYIQKKPNQNVVFRLEENNKYAAVYAKAWGSCLNKTRTFGRGL